MADLVTALLAHPDHLERALALTLRHVEPKHIKLAEKDPHPRVQAAVARWKAKNQPPEQLDTFNITHGYHNGNRMLYFHPTVAAAKGLEPHTHRFSAYSGSKYKHLSHFAGDILGHIRYTGDPALGSCIVHEVHAPWHVSPAVRGVHVGAWVNKTFGLDHDLSAIEDHGQAQLSDLAHHGVQGLFGHKNPEAVLGGLFHEWAKAKGAKQVDYLESPSEPLRKDTGYVTLPKFGVDRVPTEPMVINRQQFEARAKKLYAPTLYAKDKIGFKEWVDKQAQKGYGVLSNASWQEQATPHQERYMRGSAIGGEAFSTHGIVAHEAQHSVFAAVGQDWGHNFRENVAKTLLKRLPQKHQDVLDQVASVSGYNTYEHPEEGITCALSYLNDPKWRSHVHETHALDSLQARHLQTQVKRAFKMLRSHAALLEPKDIVG